MTVELLLVGGPSDGQRVYVDDGKLPPYYQVFIEPHAPAEWTGKAGQPPVERGVVGRIETYLRTPMQIGARGSAIYLHASINPEEAVERLILGYRKQP